MPAPVTPAQVSQAQVVYRQRRGGNKTDKGIVTKAIEKIIIKYFYGVECYGSVGS
jgi:hypothetical protein